MVTILVCGDRYWNNLKEISTFLSGLMLEYKPSEITIVEGGCRGADELSGIVAKTLGYNLIVCPADWVKYGKVAGPKRNQEMLNNHKPSMVVAFHNDYEHSKGTKDMCERAKFANIYTVLVSTDGIRVLHSKTFTIGEAFTDDYLKRYNISEEEHNQPFLL
jgi:hypothetical protein